MRRALEPLCTSNQVVDDLTTMWEANEKVGQLLEYVKGVRDQNPGCFDAAIWLGSFAAVASATHQIYKMQFMKQSFDA